jgi:hypothetical protein
MQHQFNQSINQSSSQSMLSILMHSHQALWIPHVISYFIQCRSISSVTREVEAHSCMQQNLLNLLLLLLHHANQSSSSSFYIEKFKVQILEGVIPHKCCCLLRVQLFFKSVSKMLF